jgi:hypothetical protein
MAASNDFSGGGLVGPTIPAEFAAALAWSADIAIADHVLARRRHGGVAGHPGA